VALLFNPATTVPIQFFMPSIQAAALSNAVEVSAADPKRTSAGPLNDLCQGHAQSFQVC
jgi:hypothetical protein